MPKKINVKERVDDDTIDLSLSDLPEIPVNEIAKFRRATILDLSSNRITELGKNFGTLTHLTKLDLSKNQIKSLPEDIGKLTNLRHLDLYNNKLEHLPVSFGRLKNLRYLDLKGNPLAAALARIVGPCVSTKECHDAARKIVRFMGDYQLKLNEQQKEKQRLEELEKAAVAAAALEAEQQKKLEMDRLKAKRKKEKKKEKQKQAEQELAKNGQIDNGNRNAKNNATPSKSSSIFRVVISMFFFTVLLFIAALVNVVKFPAYTNYIIDKLPNTYQPIVIEYVELVKNHAKFYLKLT